MSRNRSERSAQLKGRPKRRAASTHMFKYQLAKNPSRAEEDALRKALQESLEEHNDALPHALVTPNKSVIRGKNNRVMNSSTNSSDVSRTSNNSSSTSSASRGILNDSAKKRTRSSAVSPNSTMLSNKRAKLTTNGHRPNNISNNNEDTCDKDPSVLSGSSIHPLNKAIRTYSRSQEVNGHHDLRQQKRTPDVMPPRSSTPISKKQALSDEISVASNVKSSDKHIQVSVSKSTQTSAIVKTSNTQINGRNTDDKDLRSSTSPQDVDKKALEKPSNASHQVTPFEDQHLKLKRESKNYAYAKMTALKVNTYKSPYNYLKSANVKKVFQTGVLNNKNSIKTYSRVKKSSLGSVGTLDTIESPKIGKKSPSPIATGDSNHVNSPDSSKTTTKIIPKQFNAASRGLKNDHSSNTIDLSNINAQSQTSVNVTKKFVAPGSWSLLGVPEEKVIYLRDDEPPRRLICYPAIKHVEGDVIQVRDSVLLRSGAKTTDLPYIAKVCAFWEDAETGGVMMSLFWYYRPEHIEDGRKPHHLPDEIFASRHRDVDSVECIEDKCYVLTFNEYCRYKKRVKMEQVGATWSLADVTIPVSNESYPRRNRIPDTDVNPELVFCCRQIYDSRMKRLIKNPLINSKYGHI